MKQQCVGGMIGCLLNSGRSSQTIQIDQVGMAAGFGKVARLVEAPLRIFRNSPKVDSLEIAEVGSRF